MDGEVSCFHSRWDQYVFLSTTDLCQYDIHYEGRHDASTIQSKGLKFKHILSTHVCHNLQMRRDLIGRGGGAYSSMIWVGTCHWDLKSRPIFRTNFAEKWNPFLYQTPRATNFKQNYTKNFTLFSKIVMLSSKFRKFGIRLMKLGLFSCQF